MAQHTILMVEDHYLLSFTLAEMIRRLGHEVGGSVRTGKEAIRAARQAPPDMMIVDIRLAGPMSGPEAVAQIRSHQPMPVLYASANTDRLAAEQRRAECTRCVPKPVSLDQLRKAIEQLGGP